jgi:amidase
LKEIAFCSAVELAAMIRNGKISSSELVELYLSRIETFNPKVNAVVTLDAEGARRQAKAADKARAKGKPMGLLHGVPVTIKDGFETAGMRTTSGAPTYQNHIPKRHAAAVQRYVDAGAIILGKTNVPLFCSDSQSYNGIFGTTNNPWDLKRSPGGSSGGAAAALAAGLTGIELGSDIAGSIRLPSSWCGIYGHRPSFGIVPFRGHIPPPPGILSEGDLSVAGPLARGAADLKLAMTILAGPDPLTATAWQLALPKPRAKSLKKYRIAAWLAEEGFPVDQAVHRVLKEVVAALRSAGATVDEKARPKFNAADSFRAYQRLLTPVMASGFPSKVLEFLAQIAQAEGERSEIGIFATDTHLLHRHWLSANAKRHAHRHLWAEFFKHYDVLLCPVVSVPAIVHDTQRTQIERTIEVNGRAEPYGLLLKWAGVVTHVYLPCTSAPVGQTPEGLPVGIQIVGPYLEDFTSIDFAQRLAKVIGGFEPPPGY